MIEPADSDHPGPAHRIRIVFAGGSHLGARRLVPTQSLPMLVKRGLARSHLKADVGLLLVSGAPEKLAAEFAHSYHTPTDAVVWVSRNQYVTAMPVWMRVAVHRLRPESMAINWAITEGNSADVKRADAMREAIRRTSATIVGAVFLPLVRVRAHRYRERLAGQLPQLRTRGVSRLIVLTPLPVHRTNGVALIARRLFCESLLRGGAPLEVIDTDAVLRDLARRDVFLSGDAGHLSFEAVSRLSDAVAETILAGVAMPEPGFRG